MKFFEIVNQQLLGLPSSPTLLPTSGEGSPILLRVWLEVFVPLPLAGEGGEERAE
jgi:hypothetical protein